MTATAHTTTAVHTTTTGTTTASTRRTRALATVAATATTSAVWAVTHAAGADFVISNSGSRGVISLQVVVIVTLVFSALGWASLALLEHFSRSAHRTWTVLAVAVTALSIVPVFLEHASTSTHVGLTLIHLAVAAVLVPAFRASRA